MFNNSFQRATSYTSVYHAHDWDSHSTRACLLTSNIIFKVEHLDPGSRETLTEHAPRVRDAIAAARVAAFSDESGAVARVELETGSCRATETRV